MYISIFFFSLYRSIPSGIYFVLIYPSLWSSFQMPSQHATHVMAAIYIGASGTCSDLSGIGIWKKKIYV